MVVKDLSFGIKLNKHGKLWKPEKSLLFLLLAGLNPF